MAAPVQAPTPQPHLSRLDRSNSFSALGPGAQQGGSSESCMTSGYLCCPLPAYCPESEHSLLQGSVGGGWVGALMVIGLEVGQGGINGGRKMLWFNNPHTVDCAGICINQHITEQALEGFWRSLCLIYKSLPQGIDWGWQGIAAAGLS